MEIPKLKALLREAEEHHAAFEATAPSHDWSDWYAAYIASREEGNTPDEASADASKHLQDLIG